MRYWRDFYDHCHHYCIVLVILIRQRSLCITCQNHYHQDYANRHHSFDRCNIDTNDDDNDFTDKDYSNDADGGHAIYNRGGCYSVYKVVKELF